MIRRLAPALLPEKLTPAPWQYIAYGGYSFVIRSERNPFARRIATVSYIDGAHSFHEADARMIAAAPEMFGALEAMLFCFAHPHRDELVNDIGFEAATNACEGAERALVKARGGGREDSAR